MRHSGEPYWAVLQRDTTQRLTIPPGEKQVVKFEKGRDSSRNIRVHMPSCAVTIKDRQFVDIECMVKLDNGTAGKIQVIQGENILTEADCKAHVRLRYLGALREENGMIKVYVFNDEEETEKVQITQAILIVRD